MQYAEATRRMPVRVLRKKTRTDTVDRASKGQIRPRLAALR